MNKCINQHQNATRERIQANYGKEREKKIEGLDFFVQMEKQPNQEELSERGIMFYHYHMKRKKKLGFSENFQNTTIDEIFYKQTEQLTVNGYGKFTTENSRMRYPPWIVTLIYNHFHKTVTDEEVMYVSIVFQFVA